MHAENIPARFQCAVDQAPHENMDVHECTDEAVVFDVTFVDDEAFVLTAAWPRTLLKKLARAIALVVECFEHYGMTINWKPGKNITIKEVEKKQKKKVRTRSSRHGNGQG